MGTGKHVLSSDNWYFLKPERCILGTDDVADGICLRNRRCSNLANQPVAARHFDSRQVHKSLHV